MLKEIKVLFLLHEFPKISETFILNQITGLIDLGVDVKILASRSPQEPKVHEDIPKYNLMNRASYFDPTTPMLLRIIRGFIICFKAFIKNSLPLYSKAIQLKSLHDLFFTHEFLSNNKFDIIHAHFGPNGLLGARLKESKTFQGKLITTFYGYDLNKYLLEKGGNAYQQLLNYGDIFLPISDFFKNQLIALKFPSTKIIIHKLGINPDRFALKKRRPEGIIRLLSIARLVEKKGIFYAIKAFKKIKKTHKGLPLEYIIVGDGEKREEYINLIHEENLTDVVKIIGWKTQDEVRDIMNNSHIFILPSITAIDGDMEGTPVSLMEAMASGMPVISTYHSGIPELIEHNISGFLVPEKDIDALADRILFLLAHPEIWPEMGNAGRIFIEKNHNIKTLNKSLMSIYETVLEK